MLADPRSKEHQLPKSKVRKEAAQKKIAKQKSAEISERTSAPVAGSRDWVPYVFVPTGLFGVGWLVVFYIAGHAIPFMRALGNWNFGIGMGFITAAFLISTLWK